MEEKIIISRAEFEIIRDDRASDFSTPCKEFDEYKKYEESQ